MRNSTALVPRLHERFGGWEEFLVVGGEMVASGIESKDAGLIVAGALLLLVGFGVVVWFVWRRCRRARHRRVEDAGESGEALETISDVASFAPTPDVPAQT